MRPIAGSIIYTKSHVFSEQAYHIPMQSTLVLLGYGELSNIPICRYITYYINCYLGFIYLCI